MATVEELREKVLRYKAGEYVGRDIEDGYTTEDICIVHTDDLDSLIAAAREEGFEKGRAEGAEEARPKIAESTEKLIDWIIAMIPPEGANPEWGRKVLLDLVATATEQMVQKIQKAAYRCKPGETLHINNSIPMLVLASSVVNPEDTDFEPKHYRCIWNEEPFTSCEDYRKAGGQAEHCPWFEDKDDHLPLSPAPKEADNDR